MTPERELEYLRYKVEKYRKALKEIYAVSRDEWGVKVESPLAREVMSFRQDWRQYPKWPKKKEVTDKWKEDRGSDWTSTVSFTSSAKPLST